MAELIFWLSIFAIGYAYAGYPILLWIISLVRTQPIDKSDITPKVSVIVAAYNEEASIGNKLKNLLEQDYPHSQLEIIVASDGSTDKTDAIVLDHENDIVKLFRIEGRQGKTAVQNKAVRIARGEIVVFTDATTQIAANGIRKIVRSFSDSRVGCVGGQLNYVSKKKTSIGVGGTDYWKYERMVKRLESKINSLIGVSGCFYAVKKSIYEEMQPYLISDFVIALNTFEKGFRVVYEENAQTYEETLEDATLEFNMRIRVILRTYSALWEKRYLLNPFRYGIYGIQLISHKILRYAVPVFLLTTFITNLFLTNGIYRVTLILQLVFYASAITGGMIQRKVRRKSLFTKPYYLLLANLAAIIALVKFVRGDRTIIWTPVR